MPSTVWRRREGSAADRRQQRASHAVVAARAECSAQPCGARQPAAARWALSSKCRAAAAGYRVPASPQQRASRLASTA